MYTLKMFEKKNKLNRHRVYAELVSVTNEAIC